jgi:cell division protein FtsL
MKKLVVLLFAVSVPVLLGFKIWQVQRTQALLERIETMDQQQREWLEKNKKLLSAIAVFRSPARIEKLAREKLGLESGAEPELKIEIAPAAPASTGKKP